jgi:hypothetical protein
MLANINDIRNHQFVGNHAGDSEAFQYIETFARNEKNSTADRAEALRIMGTRGMGLTMEEMGYRNDEQFVADFMAGK